MDRLQLTKIDRSSSTIKSLIKEMTTKHGMTRKEAKRAIAESTPDVYYQNSKYAVSVFKNEWHGFPSELGDIWHLSIRRLDRETIHDWRDLQEIKNQLVGRECEAIELYPAESRVMDSANQYHLYAFINNKVRIPCGYATGGKSEKPLGNSKQRPFTSLEKEKD